MNATLSTLIERLEDAVMSGTEVIPWGSPIPCFGDLSRSEVATLGLNPSNREFVDASGNELEGRSRRFHTLKSLGLARWSDVTAQHLEQILDSCRRYFSGNPYDAWFKKLDNIISGTNASYYSPSAKACHLDLIPYATLCKWTTLSSHQRLSLFAASGDSLALLLRDSPVRILILNGNSVAKTFQEIAGVRLEKRAMRDWTLSRRENSDVTGFSYTGTVRDLFGVKLRNEILVLGFNHNIQSSFGVTGQAITAIRQWITQAAHEVLS
jgi:hypothetical protein